MRASLTHSLVSDQSCYLIPESLEKWTLYAGIRGRFPPNYAYSHIEYRNNETQSQKESSFDLFRLKKGINQALASEESPPPNMVTVAARLEHDRSHLYGLFPNECKAIAKRARDFHHHVHEEKMVTRCQEVEKAIAICKERNIFPSEREVKKLLKKPGTMRHPRVRESFENSRNQIS
jgi:hypothetical protein